ncbi:MAG: aminoglycoside phosphotransferase [Betaproteobacteria bacterium RIFCSPLOWO2_02_FULL_66_14]|nr:MAG: aminoglycoside phosphotransferase [Betaproteobacteria bacterium RIFCSPLOWO2_02_FULL_66_14]
MAAGPLSDSLPEDILAFLRRSGLAADGEPPHARRLPGGVSSDIWQVALGSASVCVKRALPRLRVAQVWEAPVERNQFEWRWMEAARRAVPGIAPRVLAHDPAGVFAMEFLDAARHSLWKDELRAGRADAATARAVGSSLGRVHAASAGRDEVAREFATDASFHAIRLEPYLLASARVHPDLARPLEALAKRTAGTRIALVHGDVSPKNILVGAQGPVFLDAECAWYGDPAFDLAFVLNHLLLKCLWVPQARTALLACFRALAEAYLPHVEWESPSSLEQRAASLLPGLLIARIDGKSPVEYLRAAEDKDRVRRIASALLRSPPSTLAQVEQAWQRS